MTNQPSELKRLEIAGASLSFVDTGSPAPSGATILLVHGFPLSHAVWNEQIALLSKRNRVIAPDLRGFGGSTLGEWPSDTEPASLGRYSDDLAELLDDLAPGGPLLFAGFSMGGYIAFSFMQNHPGRIGGLALIDTRAIADDDAARSKRLKMAEKVGEWGSARVAEMMRPALFGSAAPAEAIDETVRVISQTDPRSIAAAQQAMAARPDSTPRLVEIGLPTLVLVGESDAISSAEEMTGIAAQIPGSKLEVIPGAGHMTPVEKPDAVSKALGDFAASL